MFLLRHNIRYAGTTSWTPKHLRFLATVKLPFAEQQFLFQEMVHVISEAGQRLERYDGQLPGVVAGWRWETGGAGADEFARPGVVERRHAGGGTGRSATLQHRRPV